MLLRMGFKFPRGLELTSALNTFIFSTFGENWSYDSICTVHVYMYCSICGSIIAFIQDWRDSMNLHELMNTNVIANLRTGYRFFRDSVAQFMFIPTAFILVHNLVVVA
jgi:hypothetical protein